MSDLISKETIDKFGRGWIADKVRYEPIDLLRARFKKSIFVLICMGLITVLVVVMGWGGLTHKQLLIRLDILLGLIFAIFAIFMIQMRRFIVLRDRYDGQSEKET